MSRRLTSGLLVALLEGCGSPAPGTPPEGIPDAPIAVPTPVVPQLATATPPPSPVASPQAVASPLALPGRPVPGELSPGTAALTYAAESGLATRVEPLSATCARFGDSLGVYGQSGGGPLAARYQLTLAPFRGDGTYRTDAQEAQIGGSISIAGLLQIFVGPPFETVAEVAGDGALGRLRFNGTGVDGRRVSGVLRWECNGVQ